MPPLKHRRAGLTESMEDRRSKVWELRKAGASSRKIAAQLGVSHTTVEDDIDIVFARTVATTNHTAEELRALELERLDTLQASYWQRALGRPYIPARDGQPEQKAIPPDVKAAKLIVSISKERSKLGGLYKGAGRIDIIFIREIIRMIEQRGGDPMALFRAMAETLGDIPILIDEPKHD